MECRCSYHSLVVQLRPGMPLVESFGSNQYPNICKLAILVIIWHFQTKIEAPNLHTIFEPRVAEKEAFSQFAPIAIALGLSFKPHHKPDSEL